MDKELIEKMNALCQNLIKILELASTAFRKSHMKSIQEAEALRTLTRSFSSDLTRFYVGKGAFNETEKEWIKPYLSIVSSFDRMGYNLDGILDRLKKFVEDRILFTDRGIKEMNDIFGETLTLLENLPDLIVTRNQLLAEQMEAKGKWIFKIADGYSEEHEKRLIQGLCVPQASPVYLDILFSLKGIIAQILEISGKLVTLSRPGLREDAKPPKLSKG